jgi:hypothetical protein
MLEKIVTAGTVPCGSSKNAIGVVELDGRTVVASATGYTGEPIGYELYIKSEDAVYFWNRFVELGAVPAGLGGLLFAWMSGGNLQQMLIYVLGNLASLAALLMFRMFGKERIRKDSFLAVTFAIAVQLLMQLGRAAMGSVFGYPTAAIIGFITTDILSILFTVFIVWTVRRIEGLFEDQRNYLLRVQREQKVERGEQF